MRTKTERNSSQEENNVETRPSQSDQMLNAKLKCKQIVAILRFGQRAFQLWKIINKGSIPWFTSPLLKRINFNQSVLKRTHLTYLMRGIQQTLTHPTKKKKSYSPLDVSSFSVDSSAVCMPGVVLKYIKHHIDNVCILHADYVIH